MSGYRITVTQVMLDAGVAVLRDSDDIEIREQICTDIFRAMLTKGEVVFVPVVEKENADTD